MKGLGPDHNFLGITEPEFYSFDQADAVILPVPYEYTSSYKSGSKYGPQAIIDASHFVEYYDEVLDNETFKKFKIATVAPIDFGNKVNKQAMDLIQETALNIINQNKFLISLGAEHSVTYPLFLAHQQKYGEIGLLQFDAHSDLRDTYHNNKYSHASVAARINEHNVSITQVGIRALCMEESNLIKSTEKINTFFAHQIHEDAKWIDKVMETLPDNIYVTIDADGFDPSIIPDVGTPEPNGLTWQQAIKLFQAVFKNKNVVGFDMLEMAPKENEILSAYNLAKLVYRLLGYKSEN